MLGQNHNGIGETTDEHRWGWKSEIRNPKRIRIPQIRMFKTLG
jgi:hypothetical protein